MRGQCPRPPPPSLFTANPELQPRASVAAPLLGSHLKWPVSVDGEGEGPVAGGLERAGQHLVVSGRERESAQHALR